jgi:hypothetical protein
MMGSMTESKPIETPCQTGNLCKVPKYRNEILEQTGLTDEDRAELIAQVESSCDHETHPDDWFEDPGAGYGTPPYWRAQRARARCFNVCPIRVQCLQIGMQRIDHGVMGGYTAAQRAQVASTWAQRKEHNDAEKEQARPVAADHEAAEQGDADHQGAERPGR